MARSSKNRWPEPHHWLTGSQASPSSQTLQEPSTQPSAQPQETSPYENLAVSEGSTQPHQRSQATHDNPSDEKPVEDEYLTLNAKLTPSTANKEPESSHPVRQRRKAAERDPWTASLERSGGVDYYGPATSASAPSRPNNSTASGHASVCHDAEERLSQKQQSGLGSAQGPARAGAKRSSKASGSTEQGEKPALGHVHDGEADEFVFLI